jgi:hypothetical protein
MSETTEQLKGIWSAWPKIMAEIGPILDEGKNLYENYKYRRVYDIMERAQPIFAKHEVSLDFNILDFVDFERKTQKGHLAPYIQIRVEWTFTHADGSFKKTTTLAQAMDYGDKACNKAIMAALKYVLIPTLLINAGESIDTENEKQESPTPFDENPKSPPKNRTKKCKKKIAVNLI